MTEQQFVVRDIHGYTIDSLSEEPTDTKLKALFGLAPEASLEYARGSWGWETPSDWCECGDPNCRPRVFNGGNKCQVLEEIDICLVENELMSSTRCVCGHRTCPLAYNGHE